MIGLDTNILVRAITGDEAEQSSRAKACLAGLTPEVPGLVNPVVLAELAWSLRAGYGYQRLEIARIIERLLASPSYAVRDRDAVSAAVHRCFDEGLHFADALIGELNRASGCLKTWTFDHEAVRSSCFDFPP